MKDLIAGKRIYISGPMTNLPDLNHPRFFAVEKILKTFPVITITNPARHKLWFGLDDTWENWMRVNIAALVHCDCLYMLVGHEQSKGAVLERELALALGMTILSEHTHPLD